MPRVPGIPLQGFQCQTTVAVVETLSRRNELDFLLPTVASAMRHRHSPRPPFNIEASDPIAPPW